MRKVAARLTNRIRTFLVSEIRRLRRHAEELDHRVWFQKLEPRQVLSVNATFVSGVLNVDITAGGNTTATLAVDADPNSFFLDENANNSWDSATEIKGLKADLRQIVVDGNGVGDFNWLGDFRTNGAGSFLIQRFTGNDLRGVTLDAIATLTQDSSIEVFNTAELNGDLSFRRNLTIQEIASPGQSTILQTADSKLEVSGLADFRAEQISIGEAQNATANFGSLHFESTGTVHIEEDSNSLITDSSGRPSNANRLELFSLGNISLASGSSLGVQALADLRGNSITMGNDPASVVNFGSLHFDAQNSLTLETDSGLELVNVGGLGNEATTLKLVVNGNLSLASGSSLEVTSLSNFVADSISIGDAANTLVDLESLQFSSTGDVIFEVDTNVRLSGAGSDAANLRLVAVGAITQSSGSDLDISGMADFRGTSISVGNTLNSQLIFQSLHFESAGAVVFNADSDITLVNVGGSENRAQSLQLITATAITLENNSSLTITDRADFRGNRIEVGNRLATNANFGSLHFDSAGTVIVHEDSDMLLVDVGASRNQAADLSLVSAGALMLSSSTNLTVQGLASLQGNSIAIGNATGTTVRLGTLHFQAATSALIQEDSDINLVDVGGDASRSDSLQLTSTGSINLDSGQRLIVTGLADLKGTSITLGNTPGDQVRLGSLHFDASAAVTIHTDELVILTGSNRAASANLISNGGMQLVAGDLVTASAIDLSAQGIDADLVLNGIVRATAGTIRLTADDRVELGTNASIVTSGTNGVVIESNLDNTAGDSQDEIRMSSGSRIATSSGAIQLISRFNGGDIVLSTITTQNSSSSAILVDSASGIVDSNSTTETANLLASSGTIRLLARGGSIGNAALDQDIDIDATNLVFDARNEVYITDLASGVTVSEASLAGMGGNLIANSPLTINANVNVGASFVFTAGNSNASGDNLTINNNAVITLNATAAAVLTFNAGDHIRLSAGQIRTLGAATHAVILNADLDGGVDNLRGNITQDGTAAIEVETGNLTVNAGTGINLDTRIDTLSGTNSLQGSMRIVEFDTLTITSLRNLNGPIDVASGNTMIATLVESLGDSGDVTLRTITGNIVIGIITAQRDATITADAGGILDDANDATNDITVRRNLRLDALGNIAGPLTDGRLELANDAGVLNVVAVSRSGNIAIATAGETRLTDVTALDGFIDVESNGSLTAISVTSAGSDEEVNDVRLRSLIGNTLIGSVIAGPNFGDVSIRAAGSIVDLDSTPDNLDVQSNELTLIADTGSIGSFTTDVFCGTRNALEILASGRVTLSASGAIVLNAANIIGLDATANTLWLEATGDLDASLPALNVIHLALVADSDNDGVGVLSLGNQLSVLGDLRVQGDDIVAADGSIDLTATRLLVRSDRSEVVRTDAEQLDVTVGGSITVANLGPIELIDLDCDEVAIQTVTTSDEVSGNIAVTAGGTIVVSDDLLAGNDGVSTSVGQIRLTATSNDIFVNDRVASDLGDVLFTAQRDIRFGLVLSPNDTPTDDQLSLTTDADVSLIAQTGLVALTSIDADGQVAITAQLGIFDALNDLNQDVRAGLGIVLDSGTSIGTPATDGRLDLAGGSRVDAIARGGSIYLRGLGSLTLLDADASDDIDTISQSRLDATLVKADGSLRLESLAADIHVGELTAIRTISVVTNLGSILDSPDDATVDISAGETITLRARDHIHASAGDGYLEIAANSTVDARTTTGDLSLRSVGTLTLTALVGADVDVIANDTLTINSITAGQNVSLRASSGNVLVGSIETSSTTLPTTTTITADLGSILDAQDDQLLDIRASRITLNANISVGGTGVDNRLEVSDGSQITSTATNGNIGLHGLGDVTLSNLRAIVGNVDVISEAAMTTTLVRAGLDMDLVARTGNLLVGNLTAGGSVELIASAGGILDGEDDELVDVTAGTTIHLQAQSKIGSNLTNTFLELAANSVVSATAGTETINLRGLGQIILSSVSTNVGDIQVLSNGPMTATSILSGRDMNLVAESGDVLIGVLQANRDISATATDGSILDGEDDATVDITARNATLIAKSNIAGATADGRLEVASAVVVDATAQDGQISLRGLGTLDILRAVAGTSVDMLAASTLTARVITAGSSVSLTSNTGDVLIGQITANNSVTVKSLAGSILDLDRDSGVDISAPNFDLDAQGAIGDLGPDTQLELSANSVLTARAGTGPIAIRGQGGLTLADVNAVASDVRIVSAANLLATNVRAAGEVNLQSETENILVGSIVAGSNVLLTATQGTIQDAQDDDVTDIRAVAITLRAKDAIAGQTTDNRLELEASGGLTATVTDGDMLIRTRSAVNLQNIQTPLGKVDVLALGPGDLLATQIAAGEDVVVRTQLGDVRIGAINAGTSVSITSDIGSILDHQNDSVTDITASGLITLRAKESISGIGGDGRLDLADNSRVHAVADNQDLFLRANGRLQLTRAEATSGSVNALAAGQLTATLVDASVTATLSTSSGDVLIDSIVAGNNILVSATTGAIREINDDSQADVSAGVLITLNARDAIQGSAGNTRLEIAAGNTIVATTTSALGDIRLQGLGAIELQNLDATLGNIEVVAAGTIDAVLLNSGKETQLETSSGDINIGSITAIASVTIDSQQGAILDSQNDAVADIRGSSAKLDARNDIAGLASDGRLELDITGSVEAVSQLGRISLKGIDGLLLTNVAATGGLVDVLAQGRLTATNVQANLSATLESATSDVFIGFVKAETTIEINARQGAILDGPDDSAVDLQAINGIKLAARGDIAGQTADGRLELANGSLITAESQTGNIKLAGIDSLSLIDIQAIAGDVDIITEKSMLVTTVQAGNNAILRVKDQDMELGSIVAGGFVILEADTGSILDMQIDNVTDISAGGTIQLKAAESIAAVGGDRRLDLASGSRVSAEAVAGDVRLLGLGSLTLTDVQGVNVDVASGGTMLANAVRSTQNLTLLATSGDIRVGQTTSLGATDIESSTGSILDDAADSLVDITANTTIRLKAQVNIAGTGSDAYLELANASNLTASSTGGNIQLSGVGALRLTQVDAFVGNIDVQANGLITATRVFAGIDLGLRSTAAANADFSADLVVNAVEAGNRITLISDRNSIVDVETSSVTSRLLEIQAGASAHLHNTSVDSLSAIVHANLRIQDFHNNLIQDEVSRAGARFAESLSDSPTDRDSIASELQFKDRLNRNYSLFLVNQGTLEVTNLTADAGLAPNMYVASKGTGADIVVSGIVESLSQSSQEGTIVFAAAGEFLLDARGSIETESVVGGVAHREIISQIGNGTSYLDARFYNGGDGVGDIRSTRLVIPQFFGVESEASDRHIFQRVALQFGFANESGFVVYIGYADKAFQQFDVAGDVGVRTPNPAIIQPIDAFPNGSKAALFIRDKAFDINFLNSDQDLPTTAVIRRSSNFFIFENTADADNIRDLTVESNSILGVIAEGGQGGIPLPFDPPANKVIYQVPEIATPVFIVPSVELPPSVELIFLQDKSFRIQVVQLAFDDRDGDGQPDPNEIDASAKVIGQVESEKVNEVTKDMKTFPLRPDIERIKQALMEDSEQEVGVYAIIQTDADKKSSVLEVFPLTDSAQPIPDQNPIESTSIEDQLNASEEASREEEDIQPRPQLNDGSTLAPTQLQNESLASNLQIPTPESNAPPRLASVGLVFGSLWMLKNAAKSLDERVNGNLEESSSRTDNAIGFSSQDRRRRRVRSQLSS